MKISLSSALVSSVFLSSVKGAGVLNVFDIVLFNCGSC